MKTSAPALVFTHFSKIYRYDSKKEHPYAGLEHPYKINAAERHQLPDSAFGIPEDREFPMPDGIHVHAAEAYFRYAPEEKKPMLARNILKKAELFGVDVESPTIHEWAEK